MYRTFSKSFRLSPCKVLISVRSSDIIWNCFRSSYCEPWDRIPTVVLCETHTSSSSALRCLKRSRWLVTIGRIDVSADGANGIGVERIGVSCLTLVRPFCGTKDDEITFLPISRLASKSRSECTALWLLSWFIDSRSFSSFSFRCFCLSKSEAAFSSCCWELCNDCSNSLWRIC